MTRNETFDEHGNLLAVDEYDTRTGTYTRTEGGQVVEQRAFTDDEWATRLPAPDTTARESALLAVAREQVAAKLEEMADDAVAEVAALFDPWRPGEDVTVGAMRWFDGTVVECVQAHTTQADWLPLDTPALWKVYRTTTGDNPDPWVQPTGSHDAYPLDALVTHNGQTWRSTHAANVWEPPTQWELA